MTDESSPTLCSRLQASLTEYQAEICSSPGQSQASESGRERRSRVNVKFISKSLINYMGQLPSERSTHYSLNWETSGPIHILQVYLERDLHFQVVDVFVAMSVSHSMFDVLTL